MGCRIHIAQLGRVNGHEQRQQHTGKGRVNPRLQGAEPYEATDQEVSDGVPDTSTSHPPGNGETGSDGQ